jgi:hypothetical protein
MEHGITIKKFAQANYVDARTQGYRIRIETSDGVNMDDKIFVYRVELLDPDTGLKKGKFSHIASPTDLEQYPPTYNPEENWYRRDFVDLVFRSIQEGEETYLLIVQDIHELIDSLDLIDDIELAEEIVIGATDESSSA